MRFVSVDGGHTAEITAHDLAVADASLAEGGIIVLDDAFNEQWPGVADGVQRYFLRRAEPRAVRDRRQQDLFLPALAPRRYRAAAAAVASDTTMPEFLGEPVAFLQFTRPGLRDRLKDRVAGSPAWQPPAHDAGRLAAALGLAHRPHAAARPDAARGFLVQGFPDEDAIANAGL